MVILMTAQATEEQIGVVTAAVEKLERRFKVYPEIGKDKVRSKTDAVMVFVDGMDNTQDPDPFKKLGGVTEVLELKVTVPA